LLLSKDIKNGAPGVNYYVLTAADKSSLTGIARLRSAYQPYSVHRDYFSFVNSLSLKAHIQSLFQSFTPQKREQFDSGALKEMMSRLP
jgi:hypothetical protein